MKNAMGGTESDSQQDADIEALNAQDAAQSHSGTVTFVSSNPKLGSVDEKDQTIISQRPVAAPEEFYKSLPLSELAAMLEGKQLDHFAVEQMIGGGGMGAVFRGKDERLDRTVAIKVIPASKKDPETLRRFRLEAQAAAKLDHSNIAHVYFVGEAEQWNYIVFEFIDGVNIRDLVTLHGPLSIDDAIYYTRQVAEALQHAHDRDVVHRDIKPSNILVTATGTAKVVDMGLARNMAMSKSTADATASGITLGTFDYISPEQARDPRDADVRSDLYSLGCSLFFMLTGNPPFPEGTALQKLLNHGSVPPPNPGAWRDDVSDQLYEIIMKLMAKQPAQRYQTPAELINDLVLLAEMEDLQRSQSSGSIVINPALMQRSLLESNLSWMVAFAFLLGSTLWLQANTATIPFREQMFEAPLDSDTRSVSAEEEEASESRLDAVAGLPTVEPPPNSTATIPANVIVVSEVRPPGVPYEQWESSLYRAVRGQAENGGMVEIRGSVVLDRPIYLDDANVVIQGSGSSARIEVSASTLSELSDWGGAIELDGGSLKLSGLTVEASATDQFTDRRIGIIRLSGSSTVEFDTTDFILRGNAEATRYLSALLAVDKTSIGREEGKLAISVTNAFVRGEAGFLGIQTEAVSSNRIEVSIKDSLFVLGGYALELANPSRSEQGVKRNIRCLTEQSTFACAAGFARLDFVSGGASNLCLNRTSNRCVFTSFGENSHIQLVTAANGLNLQNTECLLFKGTDNAYSSDLTVFAEEYGSAQNLVSSLRFDDIPRDAWFAERGNERSIPWAEPVRTSGVYSSAERAEFAIESGVFAPGYRQPRVGVAD